MADLTSLRSIGPTDKSPSAIIPGRSVRTEPGISRFFGQGVSAHAPRANVSRRDTYGWTLVSCHDTIVRVIRSFKDDRAGAAFEGVASKGFPSDLLGVTRRKLGYLNAAATLNDLRAPPGNRLEALKGDRAGQHSIRVNDQWRICFIWTADGPKDVEFVDYH